MLIAIPPGDNVRIHGKSQGFLGLPVHHEDQTLIDDNGNATGLVHVLRTAWTPTPDELERLNAGASIIMEEWAELPAPRKAYVGEVPK